MQIQLLVVKPLSWAKVDIYIMTRINFVFFGLMLLASNVYAQNTGGVFPPMANPGFKSLQYRITVDPDNAKGETAVAQRIHYIQALNDDFKFTVFGGVRRTDSSDFDFDYLHTGLFWDLGEDGQNYRTGVRFDLRLGGGNRPDHVGFLWINHLNLSNDWTARATLFNSVQFGDNASDGVFLHTRWQLAKRLKSGHSIGFEMYNFYGSTDDLGSFDSQNHTLGPTYTFQMAAGWSIYSGVLFGVSDAAPDSQFRFWISRSM
jgi:hypothetical protein